jgi:hypothetical protein
MNTCVVMNYVNLITNCMNPTNLIIAKVQTKSEWIYEIINFPNIDPKNMKDFCPMYYKNSQYRNFSGHFLEN